MIEIHKKSSIMKIYEVNDAKWMKMIVTNIETFEC